jgi:O-antigen biosynthesis protein
MSLRVRSSGKFFRVGDAKWFVRGFSYGPFADNAGGEPLPEIERVRADLAHIRRLGGNCIRVYFPPPVWLLDEALAGDLRVFIDVPWEKHRCFFEDWQAREQALHSVRETARTLGNHPAVFALSVGNEIPVDVVRFYGAKRVQGFLNRLIDEAKQQAPDCPTTYVSFPTTEFLTCDRCDFYCFNVYVHDAERLGVYLDRLQHIAGNKPLILGEYGVDTIREGMEEQSRCLSDYIEAAARRGLAGAFVFAYTDDWFTGGHQITDWAFGVTDRDRHEKPAALAVRDGWRRIPPVEAAELPSVSVVVCSYNGEKTIAACLESLMRLNYPDYEVILVDDGSTDRLPSIAECFPQVVYYRQTNRGLSAARNTGASLARGDVIAFTDDDCVADEHWLLYLMQAMQDQQVEAIGGPNITPVDDGWIARCVAASPGNPSHVMLDDQYAEHVPGCNLAVRRYALSEIDGFDAQFRVAGDDVDFCWRLLDAGMHIGYASGAMVWHHRRATIAHYATQQKGYGRSEAMVHFKHPRRCSALGRNNWNGIIYGEGAVGLPLRPDRVYHGRFGSGLFQTIYRHNQYGFWSVTLSIEWHLGAVMLVLLAYFFAPLVAAAVVMELVTLGIAIRFSRLAPLPKDAPWWCRWLVAYLYFAQPIWRGWHRYTHLLKTKQLRPIAVAGDPRRISASVWDQYWDHSGGLGRNELLPAIVEQAREHAWGGDYDNAWTDWDLKLVGDRWHNIHIRTATEELGWPRKFTRARCSVKATSYSRFVRGCAAVWCGFALVAVDPWALAAGLLVALGVVIRIGVSRRRCLRAVTSLVAKAADTAGLTRSEIATPPDSDPELVQAAEFKSERMLAAASAERNS